MDSFDNLKIRLDHIGIAVRDLAAATSSYEQLGLVTADQETIVDQGVEVVMLPVGDSRIELLCPYSENSPVADFLERKGEGVHHIALAVPDIRATIQQCQEAGLKVIDAEPRIGACGSLIAFVHPKSTGGVLIELTQKSSNSPK